MEKGFYSSIVIISAITTCILINIISSDEPYQNRVKENLIEIKEKKDSGNKVKNNEGSKEQVKESEIVIEAKSEIGDAKVVGSLGIPQKSINGLPNQECFVLDEDDKGDDVNYEISAYKSVFKVDSGTIISELSMFDKLKLLSISNKLSTTDYEKIDGYLKEANSEEGVKKAYKILKERLNDKDMEKIKDILARYIDVEVIEKK